MMPDTAFEVEIRSTGQVITVPARTSVLDALAFEGVDIQYSCAEGICGTCVTGVVSGEPDHRDSYLTPEEHSANKLFTPCCSRALSARLVLDL